MNQEQIKKRKREYYLKTKLLKAKEKNCQYCVKPFMSYMGTVGYWTKFCSITCSVKKQHANNSKNIIKNNDTNNEHSLLLREYWAAYHDTLISIEDVLDLKIMKERFVSNKAYDKYDLFAPNNVKA